VSDKLVTIAVFGHSTDAHLARSALEVAGIRVALQNEETSSLLGSMSSPFGGVRLVVRSEDEPVAVKVLEETFGANERLSEEELGALAVAAPPDEGATETVEPAHDPVRDANRLEQDARVAANAAGLGLVIPFATLFSIVILFGLWPKRHLLSSTGRANFRVAFVLALWPLILGLALFVWYTR
jgi:hypothetical protein